MPSPTTAMRWRRGGGHRRDRGRVARPLDHSIAAKLTCVEPRRSGHPTSTVAAHPGVSSLPLQAVEPKRLYRQIADQLAQLIAKGEFPPGSRLPAERELAVSLGVSRTSVREAIISLEMSGLVEVRVGTGIFVDDAPGSRERRQPRRGPGTVRAARRAQARRGRDRRARRDASRRRKTRMRCARASSASRPAPTISTRASRRTATSTCASPRRPATARSSSSSKGLWDQRAELWGRMQQHFHTTDLAERTIRDHAAIVAAVAAHNPDGARAAMHRHLARVAREFQRGVDKSAEPAREPAGARVVSAARKRKAAQAMTAQRRAVRAFACVARQPFESRRRASCPKQEDVHESVAHRIQASAPHGAHAHRGGDRASRRRCRSTPATRSRRRPKRR